MKRIALVFLVCFALCFALAFFHDSFAQPPEPADEPIAPAPDEKQVEAAQAFGKSLSKTQNEEKESMSPAVRAKPTMDGLKLLIGAYSPFHDEMKGIYGSMFSLGGQYCLNMGRSIDLVLSVGLIQDDGDPYHNVPTFSTGESATIMLIPMELSLRRRIVLMRSPAGFISRGFYVGGGVNYIRASEEIPGLLSAEGGDFGLQVLAGPQMFFTENLALEGEIKFLMNDVNMKDEDDRYSITLTGLVIRAALSFYY